MRSRSAEKLSKHCVLSVRMIRRYAMPACGPFFHRPFSMKRMEEMEEFYVGSPPVERFVMLPQSKSDAEDIRKPENDVGSDA